MRAVLLPFVVVVLLVGAVSAAVPAGAVEARGARPVDVDAFRFTVDPPRIVVGDTKEAVITIEARDDDGAALDTAPPRLTTSTGTISEPQRVAPGVFKARFVPPTDAFPHVALVSASIDTVDDTAVGFVTVPLWGRGQTTVKTKPGSKVTVYVGADAFGPVVAGDDGSATVSMLVPPGPERAIAKSVDAVGNESQKTIDLAVPPFNRLAVLSLDDIVPGDGNGRARVLAFVVDKKGAPLVDAVIKAEVGVGVVEDDVRGIAPGMFEVLWRPGALKAQVVPITLALEGAVLSRATTSVRVIAGAPARADVIAPKQSLSADEARELSVRVTAYDSGGNPVPFGAARVDVDVGRIDRVSGGEASKMIAWVLPARLVASAPAGVAPSMTDKRTATLRVRAADGVVLGEARVLLVAGKPATLAMTPFDEITADGSAAAPVVVTAADVAGNAVVPQGVVLEASGGRFVAANVDAGNRVYRALYVPDPRDEEGVVDVKASLGALVVSSPLRLKPRPRALLLVGPALTSSWSYGPIGAAGVELSTLVRLPVLDGALHAGLNLGVLEGIGAVSQATFLQHRSFPVMAEVAWRPLLLKDLGLHVGVDAGLVVTDVAVARDTVDDSRIGADDQKELRQIEPAVGGAGVVGVAYRVGPGFVELDLRGGYAVPLGDSLVDGSPWGAGVSLGYRFGI